VTDDEKQHLRAILRRQRESHQKLFDLQGTMIEALKDALEAVARTQDEMMRVFQSDNDLDDQTSGGDA
jgi:hypothetical protein